MAEFSKFSEITFIDGASPPINADNLNELERVVALADEELGRTNDVDFSSLTQYFLERNSYTIEYFNDSGDWTNHYPAQSTVSEEEDDNLIGNLCIKILNDVATAGWMSISKTYSPVLDLTEFYDGSASTTDDLICFYFYVSDDDAISNIEIKLGDDFSNCYFYEWVTADYRSGWNVKYVPKSDFTTVGAPTGWDNIAYFRIAPYVEAGYSGEYVYLQYALLARQDPVYSGYANMFQKYYGSVTGWQNEFSVYWDFCALYRDHYDLIEKIGFMKLDGYANQRDQLLIYPDTIEFISKFEFYCKYAGESTCITWYIDSSNWIETYISSDTFYLIAFEAAASTTESIALDVGLIKNERFYIYFEKEGDTCRSILMKDGEPIKILEHETSISSSSDGSIFFGQITDNSYSFCTDFKIGNKKINFLRDENLPVFIYKKDDQSFSNNTLADVDRMGVYFPPNGLFKVELVLVCRCSDTTPDIKVSWDKTDLYILDTRAVIGPNTGMTDVASTNVRTSLYNYGTSVPYGCDGTSGESIIRETLIVLSEQITGGKLQLKAAQNNTDGSNPTVIEGTSYMIITPLNGKNTE